MGVIRVPGLVEGVPDREGHAEEALPGDQPVAVEPAHPVVVAVLHVPRHPAELLAAVQEDLLELGVAAAVADVPLPGGDDLQRLVALLVEVGLALGRGRLAVQLAGGAQLSDHHLPGGEGRLPGDLVPGHVVADPVRAFAEHPAVAPDDHPGRQLQLPPPGDVGQVAERAAHGDPGALVRLRGLMRQHRQLDPVDGRGDRTPEQRLVALVVRVGDQGHAGGDQLGPGGLDVDRAAAVRGGKGHPVVRAGIVPGLQFGLGHRGLEGHIPQRRRLGQIGLPAGRIAQESFLGNGNRVVGDRGVEARPVDAQPHPPPQILEGLLVDVGQFVAEGDEIAPADPHLVLRVDLGRRHEVRVVRDARVAAHAVEVLHPALGRQPVVVPADRIEDVQAGHPPVAGDQIGMGVGEHVPDVQRSGHRRRRGIDAEDLGPGAGPDERVGVLGPPALDPFLLQTFQRRLVRYPRRARGGRGGTEVGRDGHIEILETAGDLPLEVSRSSPARLGSIYPWGV